jgi:uncharacterized protein YdhG (YjbR/CyaY superfamily)
LRPSKRHHWGPLEAQWAAKGLRASRDLNGGTNSPPKSVDEYIAAAPKEVQAKLRQVRAAIREAAPRAAESISYGMPYYSYKGRLAWFGLHKEHIGIYLRPPVVQEHKKELARYETTKSAVHLPLGERIPVPLIKGLVKARMRKNDAEEQGRRRKRSSS